MVKFEKYLQASDFFDYNKSRVKNKALEITKNKELKLDKIKALFYWVRDEIKYNMMSYVPEIKANFKASVTLRRGYGFCVSKAILLSTFARSVKIPARIHLADIINHKISQKVIDFMGTNIMYYHGYSEVFLDDKWLKLAPVFDKDTAQKAGFLPLVDFDENNNAMFSKYDNEGNLFVEYVEDHGVSNLFSTGERNADAF
ncbi:MAG: transglutaminase [Candidatus Lokiarchaeota archaeon]|nr:transglutaminase [Candidatus Lokiarchaeota archaeon]